MNIERLKNFFKKEIVVDTAIFLLLALLSLSWFRGNNLIGGGDFGMTTDWVKYFKIMFYSWDETFSMGMPAYRQVALLIPYALVGAFFQSLGFSIVFIEKFFFYSWFAGSGLSMYFLCSVLGMKRAGRLVSSIFYMLNPFSLIIIWIVSHGLIQMPYAFAPLVLGLYIYGLKRKKGLNYIIIANIIWLFSTGSANANPRITIIHWLPIAFYFVGSCIFNKDERKFILKYTLEFLGLWVLFNFYWLFIFIRTINESVISAHSPFLLPDEAELKLTSVKFFEAIRMLGYWSLKSGYKGDPYYPYWNFFNSFWVNLVSWLIPLFVILGLVNKETKKQPLRFFFIVMLVFGLIGINGANPPIGNAIVWFYKLFPPLMLLARFNFLFFGIPTYLIFCVLLGYGFLLLYELVVKKIGRAVGWGFFAILIVLLNIFLVFPFWSGEVIRVPGKLFPGERYQIPSYWFEAKEWLSGQKDFFRVFPLPMSTTYNVAMKWGEGYAGGDLTRWFMPQPVINANTGDTYKIPEQIGKSIEQETDFSNISNLLGFLNVKYLLVRNDTRWEFMEGHDWWFSHTPENIAMFIKQQGNLSLEKTFGNLEFYRVADNIQVPKIYIPQKMIVIDGRVDDLPPMSQFLHPEEKDGFLITEQNNQKLNFNITDLTEFVSKAPSQQEGQEPGQASYDIEIKEEGKYKILMANDGILDFYQKDANWQIAVDKVPVLEKGIEHFGDNLISLGEIELSLGKHTISMSLPPSLNLTTNSSFEEKQEQFQYSPDAVDGEKSLSLVAGGGASIISIPIVGFSPGASYTISLSAKNVSGDQPLVLLWENLDESQNPSFNPQITQFGYADLKTVFSRINLPVGKSWESFNFAFKPNLFSKSVGIALISNSSGVTATENLFDKLEVYRLFDNPLVLQRLAPPQESVDQTFPEMKFRKISPVKYEVEIEKATKPFFLIFSESFHPGWTISSEGEHFMANGFANGWYITKLGDYKFTISFALQKIYYFSISVSLVAFLGFGTYLTYKRLGKNN